MCGRFSQSLPFSALRERFAATLVREELPARFNIAPTDRVAVVHLEGPGSANPSAGPLRVLEPFRWGLVPSWAESMRHRPQPFNARAESLASNGLFRALLPRRRCLVLADGFYEWQGPKADRRPVHLRLRGGVPFAFAGLWDLWRDPADPGAPPLRSCTVVTTVANSLVQPIHDRMPVILSAEDEARWLDPALRDPAALLAMLRPRPAEAMEAYPVSPHVNDVRHQGPDCARPLSGSTAA